MKIGILTYHLSHNYGAFLQAYALTMNLRKALPKDNIEIIDFNMKVAEKYYRKVVITENNMQSIKYNIIRYKAFRNSKKLLPVSAKELHSDKISEFNEMVRNEYDVIVAGSDEIWRLTGSRGFPNPYWLPGKLGCVKMSFAASSRSDFSHLNVEKSLQLKELIDDFYYVGVRDQSTYDSIVGIVSEPQKVHMNCDPTLIYRFSYSREKGMEILKNRFGVDISKPTIGVMLTNGSSVKSIRNSINFPCNIVSLFQKHKSTYYCADLTPFEWVDVISALDFLVTSFFHGVCFALNTNIPFAALEKNKVNTEKSKIQDLLTRISLCDRFFLEEDIQNGNLLKIIRKEYGMKLDYESHLSIVQNDFESFVEAINKLNIGNC